MTAWHIWVHRSSKTVFEIPPAFFWRGECDDLCAGMVEKWFPSFQEPATKFARNALFGSCLFCFVCFVLQLPHGAEQSGDVK